MRDVSCKLLSTIYEKDEKGVLKPKGTVEREIPILKTEDIYAKEYYEASQAGYKPSLRLKISALNYNKEEELIYMGTTYTIVRTSEPCADEIVLICERKIKNVQNNRSQPSNQRSNESIRKL